MASESRHARERLLKLSFEHGAAERAADVDRVMATLCNDPVYELFPINYRMEGIAAVREFYRRSFSFARPGAGSTRISAASGNLGDLVDVPVDVLWVGSDSLVTRDDVIRTGADGLEYHLRFLSIFTLSSSLLQGEIIFSSAAGCQYMKDFLGQDFVDFPGVSVIR